MSGVKISLKKKSGPKKLLRSKEEDTLSDKIPIDSFSKEKSKPKAKLVIKPNSICNSLQQETAPKLAFGLTEFEPTEMKTNEISSESIVRKRIFVDSDEESDSEQAIPVEEFGAAFLRGFGWDETKEEEKGEEEKETKESITFEHRQRGLTLGIGAKTNNPDLIQELHKEQEIPLVKRDVKR
ncbi:SPP2 [Candida oxycetoniae]|uniref:SPP2 n=1 Tax=Candida oxycetoniae TaxID=497107 RepID=A0AAI9X0F8_9ASCO|nr:SPP2 [Candida oxycetoniae]KAI3407000.2 SPP2 [Candida oxycetoniae]